ncbi:MAG: cysteine desulfurase [Candidatus Roizmanbacteria bacterium]
MKTKFPLLAKYPKMTYLDSGATTLKPQSVIDAELEYYRSYSANIHRGLYPLSIKATEAYDASRKMVAVLLNARSPHEIVFAKGATDGLNLLAMSLTQNLESPDEIVCTILEHHSNFVPWQQISQKKDLNLRVIDFPLAESRNNGINASEFISSKTKILTLPYISNVTGEVLPIKQIVAASRKINPELIVIVDACQAVAHIPIDVQDLDCDFLVFSGHKLYGPTGIGVLYGKGARLEALAPYQYGGDMIHSVSLSKTTFAPVPAKFEAGTPPIAQAIGLGEAIRFILGMGFESIQKHESELYKYAIESLSHLATDLEIVQPVISQQKGNSIITFTSPFVHPHDMADLLGQSDVCIRAGHHCAQPLHDHLHLNATARISFGLYNRSKDIDTFCTELKKIIGQFQ